jgi:cytidine deaminase
VTRSEISFTDAARAQADALDLGGLFVRARDASAFAYAPYSGFRAGAAILLADGSIVTGCNVENSSYGVTICAERAALARCVAEGHRDLVAIAVAADTDIDRTVVSCGACLQALSEFDPDETLVVSFTREGAPTAALLRELLPLRFRLGRSV